MRPFKSIWLLAIATPLLAQRDSDVVPRQLTLSILHFQSVAGYGYFGSGNGEPTLSTELPASISGLVPTPPRAEVMGSVAYPRLAEVFGVAEGTTESVRGWFIDEFKRRNYSLTNDETQMARFGGFRDPQPGSVNRGGGYCAGTDLLNADVLAMDSRRVEYRIRVTKQHQNCVRNQPIGRAPAFVQPPEFPTLLNPANATTAQAMYTSGCGEREYGSSGTAVTLNTTMSPAELIKHYDRQMGSAGWKSTGAPSMATSTWTKQDAEGSEVIMTLTASAGRLTPTCRYVQMTVSRPPARIK